LVGLLGLLKVFFGFLAVILGGKNFWDLDLWDLRLDGGLGWEGRGKVFGVGI
jgi:hypothetical protein